MDEEEWRSLQEAEHETLVSTFEEDLQMDIDEEKSCPRGLFTAYMALPDGKPLSVIGPPATEDDSDERRSTTVEFMPPATLRFSMPPGYPVSQKPEFDLRVVWLSPRLNRRLIARLNQICEENEGGFAIFAMCQFLREEATGCLGLEDGKLDLLSVFKVPKLCAGLFRFIVESDIEQKDNAFRRQTHECSLCASDKLGSDFMRIRECGHYFCVDCTRRGFEMHIREGEVDKVKCFCCDVSLPQYQLRSLISTESFERHERLTLARGLESMTDVAECPRPECRTPVVLDLDDSLGVCSKCSFAFCMYCQRTYHGVNPCRVKDVTGVIKAYRSSNREERDRMDKTYGRRNLEKMCENFDSEKYLETAAVLCPHCRAPTEKIDGCNKMTCSKCNRFFCWLCCKLLDMKNPYNHYSTGECRNRLFAGVNPNWEEDFFDDELDFEDLEFM